MRIIRDKLGPIPEDHFENEPCGPAKNVSPLSKEWIEYIESLKQKLDEDDKGVRR